MVSGKFDEELNRMSRLVEQLKPGALILFNESFASTNDREGSEIAGQIVRALLEKGIRVFFVTHLYEFANSFYQKGSATTEFLRPERTENAERTFRVIPGKPEETSYGTDLYRRIFESEKEAPQSVRRNKVKPQND